MSTGVNRFKALLGETYIWPTTYLFKFIVPADGVPQLRQILNTTEVTTKNSRKGTYVGVTARMMLASSDDVIQIYQRAGKIKGIISL